MELDGGRLEHRHLCAAEYKAISTLASNHKLWLRYSCHRSMKRKNLCSVSKGTAIVSIAQRNIYPSPLYQIGGVLPLSVLCT